MLVFLPDIFIIAIFSCPSNIWSDCLPSNLLAPYQVYSKKNQWAKYCQALLLDVHILTNSQLLQLNTQTHNQ